MSWDSLSVMDSAWYINKGILWSTNKDVYHINGKFLCHHNMYIGRWRIHLRFVVGCRLTELLNIMLLKWSVLPSSRCFYWKEKIFHIFHLIHISISKCYQHSKNGNNTWKWLSTLPWPTSYMYFYTTQEDILKTMCLCWIVVTWNSIIFLPFVSHIANLLLFGHCGDINFRMSSCTSLSVLLFTHRFYYLTELNTYIGTIIIPVFHYMFWLATVIFNWIIYIWKNSI